MAGNERFDDSIGRWLEETAPNRLPQRVLDATFDRTRRTRQDPAWRAVPGRLQMPRFIPASGAMAVVVLATVLALNVVPLFGPGGSPTPQPSATASPSTSQRPSPAAGFSRFTSTHGISIDYPSGWQVRPATEPWDHEAFTFDAPGVDVIFDPTREGELYLSLASEPLGGRGAGDWCCSDLWAAAEVCEFGGNFGRITVDGAKATIRGCDGLANRFEDHVVQVATATHGYVIYLHVGDDPSLQATFTEGWFDAALETVDLP